MKIDANSSSQCSCEGSSNGCSEEKIANLPIQLAKTRIVRELKKYETVILIGETGCGKSTQMPKIVFEQNMLNGLMVGVTQPRRMAAVSLALRVASEMGYTVGELVGYSVRFDSVTSERTRIHYLTDGMLLREAIADPLLKRYAMIILDEAHERTVQTDVLFGVMKNVQNSRKMARMPNLQIVLMSATMDVDHISEYFDNAPVLYCEGRQFPIQVFYTSEPQSDFVRGAIVTMFQLHRSTPIDGDILVFLTGQEQIDSAVMRCRRLVQNTDVGPGKLQFLPLYAAMSPQDQMRVFEEKDAGVRRVVFTTNVAETSLTIPGIKYVVDAGKVKVRLYEPSRGIDMLKVVDISQAQARQRAGRAGREAAGQCYRVYTCNHYEQLHSNPVPEILRCNLTSIILSMLALRIRDVSNFDFLDKPKPESIKAALKTLQSLGAVEPLRDGETKLRRCGWTMCRFPIDPKLSRILIASVEQCCTQETLTVVSLMSCEDIFVSDSAKKKECESARQRFFAPEGDVFTAFNAFNAFNNVPKQDAKQWCQKNFINYRNVLNAKQIRAQLRDICLAEFGDPLKSCGERLTAVRKAMCSGLFVNSGKLERERKYRLANSTVLANIHPSSCLFRHQPACVLYSDLVFTSDLYIKDVTVIDADWLTEVPQH